MKTNFQILGFAITAAAVMAACAQPAPRAPAAAAPAAAAEITIRWRTRPGDAGEQKVYEEINKTSIVVICEKAG